MTPLSQRVERLQVAIVRELNDIHIFVRQAIPLLDEARSVHAASTSKRDKRYFVPSIGRSKFARRTDRELKQIYDRFTSRRLYESFLIAGVAEFESFLSRVLREIIREYPPKLSIGVPGISPCRQVAVEVVLDSTDLDEVLERTIGDHLRSVFYAQPKAYLEYLAKVAGVASDDPAFAGYVEIKATRDLLVHNGGIVNGIYLEKVGDKARGTLGAAVGADSEYFDGALATLKRVSGIIKRDVEKTFGK